MSVKIAGNKLNGETIQPVGFPDYTNRTSLTWGSDNSVTITQDGWIAITSSFPNNNRGDFYVDGVSLSSIFQGASNSVKIHTTDNFLFPVRKNSKLSYTGYQPEIYLYPMLGMGT